MNPKPGIRTSEFWMTAVVNIFVAILAVLAARGMVTQEEAAIWVVLAQAVAVAVAPIVMAIVTGKYIEGRAYVKATNGSSSST